MRKTIATILVSIFVFSLFPVVSLAAPFSQGDGTESNPYGVSTPEDLNAVRNYPSAHFIMLNDIDMSAATSEGGAYWNDGAGWEPICNSPAFRGDFDGNGYAIIGLKQNIIRDSDIYGGLFGCVSDGIIRNLGLEDSSINITVNGSHWVYVGGITGSFLNINDPTDGYIENCYNKNTIIKVDAVNSSSICLIGGIVGSANEGLTINNCHNTANIECLSNNSINAGGIVGFMWEGTINACVNNGMITSSSDSGKCGGIAGTVYQNVIISNSYNTGNVSGGSDVGGISGETSSSSMIDHCYNTGSIDTGRINLMDYVGGISGDVRSDSTINCCYNTGNVNGYFYAGGISGYVDSIKIIKCYNKGSIKCSFDAGGISGYVSKSEICNSYNTGSVKSYRGSGGISGNVYIDCELNNCYNAGIITGSYDDFGSIVGNLYTSHTKINNCYYSARMSKGIGNGYNMAVALTTEELRQQGSYVNFDFETVWTMAGNETYALPELQDLPMLGTYVTSITVSSPSETMIDQGTLQMSVTSVLPETADNKSYTWSVKNGTGMAEIDKTGLLRATKVGNVIVEATADDCDGAVGTKEITILKKPVAGVKLVCNETTIVFNERLKLTAEVFPANASYPALTWSSSNPAIVTVDQDGTITAVAFGSATIKATADGVSDTCEVTVVKKDVSRVSLDFSIYTLVTGETSTLTARVFPEDATNKQVSWSSSNPSIATVDQNGKVTAVCSGDATITASADGTWAICQVTVLPGVSYQSHVQNIGWQEWKEDGDVSGTSGRSLRLEAICIKMDRLYGGIEYQTHVQNIGWMDWVSNGALSGTSGQSLRLEAIKIRLTGLAADKYDVYYRVHAENFGWMGWAKNGESSGTAGYSYRLEAIQIKLVSKGGPAPGSTKDAFVDCNAKPSTGSVTYQSHVQNIGWQDWKSNGDSSGTSGQSLRLEAMCMKLENVDGGIEYQTHVQDIGWMDWVSNGALSGTSGRSLRLEAIRIRLTGAAADKYDIYYRVHAQNIGWMGWAKNGASSGTAGFCYRLEAIQIVLVAKGGAAPGDTTDSFVQNSI